MGPQAAPRAERVKAARLAEAAPIVGGARGTAEPAIRCAECHNAAHEQWLKSGHARANQSPLYLAMRSRTSEAACNPCHTPLKALVEPGELAADEGITCDACHAIKEVALDGPRARIAIDLAENVKWGTLCETQEHYFHKTGCLPLFSQSDLCAGCHRWSLPSDAGQTLDVLTEYDEWLGSPAARAGVTCAGCHMPRSHGEVATGWRRAAVVDHGCMGADGALRRTALGMRLSVEHRGDKLRAAVALSNEAAGHAAPTGLPGRQIVLRVAVLDTAGHALEQAERIYSRVVVDAAGIEAPFFAAHAEAADHRIAAGETRREELTFQAIQAGEVRASLVWRRASPAVAAALGVTIEEQKMTEVRVALAPQPANGKARPPITAEVKGTPLPPRGAAATPYGNAAHGVNQGGGR